MYELYYNEMTGKVIGVLKREGNTVTSFLVNNDNTDYQAFLIWNKAQKTPLDLNSTIPVIPPVPSRDLAKEITELKERLDTQELKVEALEVMSIGIEPIK
jgi:hypothetical protein